MMTLDTKSRENVKIKFLCIKKTERLARPYKLSFGTVNNFDSVFVYILKGKKVIGIGESTLLPGYSPETQEETFDWCEKYINENINEDPKAILQVLNKKRSLSFKHAALVTAIESYLLYNTIFEQDMLSVPVLGTVHSQKNDDIRAEVEQLSQKYRTIKVKVGNDCNEDISKIAFIQNILKPGVKLRIDANQGYNFVDAKRFVSNIIPESIECIEQPLPISHWKLMCKLKNSFPKIEFMLDEAIRTKNDIDKAVKLGCCQYIKLKLFKCGSIHRMIDIAEYAHQKGLKVIIGNGVQHVIGALQEAFVYHELRRRDIPISDTELTGPLKIDKNISNLCTSKGAKLYFFPGNILSSFYSNM